MFTVIAGSFSIYSGLNAGGLSEDHPLPTVTTTPLEREPPTLEVQRRLDVLLEEGRFSELQQALYEIQPDPRLAHQYAFYSLALAVSSSHKYPTPPLIYFDRIDPASPLYEAAIHLMVRYYYFSSNQSWRQATDGFTALESRATATGMVSPMLYFLRLAALGPDAKYKDIERLYSEVLSHWGGHFSFETGGTYDVSGGFEGMIGMEHLVQIPSLLLVYNLQLGVSASREGRRADADAAKQRVHSIIHHRYRHDEREAFSWIETLFVPQGFALEQYRMLFPQQAAPQHP